MSLAQIDFAQIPAPAVIEPLDFETILAAMKIDLLARDASLTASALESGPIAKLLEVCAMRELIVRQRVNDGAHAVMLTYASGPDLDQIGANFGVARLIITPADNTKTPPVAAVMELDNAYRERIRLSLYSRTTAGPVNQYKFHALSADPDVLDVSITSPNPGDVVIAVLSRTGSGVPPQSVLDAVMSVCNADDIRPLTDHVIVQAAAITNYTVAAALTVYPGPDPVTVQAAALKAVTDYCNAHHALGHDITRAGLIAAATVAGVQNVALTAPAADLTVDDLHAGYATAINMSIAGSAI
ncbi:MAG: baseplate J/gp47 family protein [Mariprofundaceae bacterium]|nr:baseplate J/gp47 family protein [Mariprofundaceae bacterium]